MDVYIVELRRSRVTKREKIAKERGFDNTSIVGIRYKNNQIIFS